MHKRQNLKSKLTYSVSIGICSWEHKKINHDVEWLFKKDVKSFKIMCCKYTAMQPNTEIHSTDIPPKLQQKWPKKPCEQAIQSLAFLMFV